MELREEYRDYLRVERRYSPRTEAIYLSAIEEFFKFTGRVEGEDLEQLLNPVSVRAFTASLMDRGLSHSTINLKLSAISSYSKFLVRSNRVSKNPLELIKRPKQNRVLPKFFPKSVMERYFSSRPEPPKANSTPEEFLHFRDAVIVELLYSTAIRRAEITTITIGDIDFSRSTLRVVGKGDKERELPVVPALSSTLKRYITLFQEHYPYNPENLLFLTDSGNQLYLSFVNRAVERELSKSEGFIGKRSPHVLRHSLATHLLNNGAELTTIKELLGHSSLAATQHYTHNSFEQLKTIFQSAHPRAKKGD